MILINFTLGFVFFVNFDSNATESRLNYVSSSVSVRDRLYRVLDQIECVMYSNINLHVVFWFNILYNVKRDIRP